MGGVRAAVVGALFVLGWPRGVPAAEPEAGPDDLRPGLVATFRDDAKPAPAEVTRLEPAVALLWGADEAAHPRLAARGGGARWEGFLNVPRAGAYRFRVVLRGRFRLSVAGKEVLAAEVKDEQAASREGPEARLEAGVHPLTAEFTRLPGAARVDLYWRAGYFLEEPLSYAHLGHLPKRLPAALGLSEKAEYGRYLAEERACVRCHRPGEKDRLAQGLTSRQGPDLSQVGQRTRPGWIYRWLESPRKLSPGAVMPELFADDEAGRVERYAVTRYLVSLGGPLRPGKEPDDKEMRTSIARGEVLFLSTGCAACHRAGERPREGGAVPASFYSLSSPEGASSVYPLPDLADKTTPDKLAAFLANPLAVDPSGRMPHLLLRPEEARDLARYLCRSKGRAEDGLPAAPDKEAALAVFKRLEERPGEHESFQRLSADDQWLDLGRRLVIAKGCTSCHTVAPGGKPLAAAWAKATFDQIKKKETHRVGCLAAEAKDRGQAPGFGFADQEAENLRVFLRDGISGAGSPAPAHAARVALKRFNCLACHSRDGEGGLTADLLDELRRVEKAENAEAVSPPPLSGASHKLNTAWLKQVLTGAGRARPWMGLRMPQFGEAHVGRLSEGLAALEGAAPEREPPRVSLSSATIEVGRQLVGKTAFGCVSCHDLAGVPNSGTRGPDLASMSQRVRYDWYRRWLEQPQRMQPGTRMPGVFQDGRSPLDKVLDGKADGQAEAMWAYLSLGPNLPLPDGLDPPKGLVLAVKDRPVLLRTFLPDAGTRAVAVGYPGGVSLAFDAAACRLAYAWSGNFLDASPVWNDRGGNPAKVLGARFWHAPPGCPWGVSNGDEPPNFAARAVDPAYGGPLPEGKVYDGPAQLHFDGFGTDKAGMPTFRYRVESAEVTERPEPLRAPAGVGVARQFTLRCPKGQAPWFLAGETAREPRLLDAKGTAVALDLKPGVVEVPAADRLVALPQDGGRMILLALADGPEGSRWHLRRQGSSWLVLLRLPAAKDAAKTAVSVRAWAPYRDDPGLIKDLLASK